MRHSQHGMTLIGMLLVAGLLGFSAVVAMKLLPLYMDAGKINAAIENLSPDAVKKGEAEIYKRINAQLAVDSVKDFQPEESVSVEKEAGKIVVTAEYELRKPMFGGLDVVLVQKRVKEFPN